MKTNIFLKYLSFVFLVIIHVGCSEDDEPIFEQNESGVDILEHHWSLSGSIAYPYVISSGEVWINDVYIPIKTEEVMEQNNPKCWIAFFEQNRKNHTDKIVCDILSENKIYTLVVPYVRVLGEPWHVYFDTETDAELYVDALLVGTGDVWVSGTMNVYGCNNPDCKEKHYNGYNYSPTMLDYTCDLTIEYTSDKGSFRAIIKELHNQQVRVWLGIGYDTITPVEY